MSGMTIKDIAKLANVSASAVSLVINGKEGVGEAKRRQILEIVEQTGYVPNPNAKRLSTERSNNIAVVFREDVDSNEKLFYMELVDSVLDVCNRNNYNLVCTSYRNKDNTGFALPSVIGERDVAGVLVFGEIPMVALSEIVQQGLPVVLLDAVENALDCISVKVDYCLAAYTATKHLLDLGHTRLAYIGNDKLKSYCMETFHGFQKAADEYNVAISMHYVLFDAYDTESLERAVDRLIEGELRPTAIFCASDTYAALTMRYLYQKGFVLPKDMSIIAIDDTVVAEYTMPPLTTIRVDRKKMGDLGFQLLMSEIGHKPTESIILTSNELVVRGSTAELET